jgi:hypothetical protein
MNRESQIFRVDAVKLFHLYIAAPPPGASTSLSYPALFTIAKNIIEPVLKFSAERRFPRAKRAERSGGADLL